MPPALFANAHLLLNKLCFAAELKNKNLRFLHAVSSYAKLSSYFYFELLDITNAKRSVFNRPHSQATDKMTLNQQYKDKAG